MSSAAPRRLPVWVLFVAGPVIWGGHFMAVYLLAEAVCAAGGTDARLLGLRPVSTVTLAATAIAVVMTLVLAVSAYRHWRERRAPASDWLDGDDLNPGLALAGALLGVLFVIAILFVGLPAAFLEPC